VFDAFGNLVGFGSPDPLSDSVLVAMPVQPEMAALLPAARIGGSPAVLASLAPAPDTLPRSVPIPLPVEEDQGNVLDSDASTVSGAAAAGSPVGAGAR
jgi:hypothetical protein